MKETLITAGLLLLSNLFMIIAWYGHLKYKTAPIFLAIIASWGIAFFEYCIQVPANRIGYRSCSAYQLKIMQECITIMVFMVFAWLFLSEGLTWRYVIAFLLIILAVLVAFWPQKIPC
jgi:uncharacterized protein (DUF486 family)